MKLGLEKERRVMKGGGRFELIIISLKSHYTGECAQRNCIIVSCPTRMG